MIHGQDPVSSYVSCKSSEYSSGYEDGWKGNFPKVLKSLAVKMVQGASCLAGDSSCPTATPEEISYTRGYQDGEKDRKCQESKR